MKYKGFIIDHAPRDDGLYIISYRLSEHLMEIVGHSLTVNEAQKMIDFHLNVEHCVWEQME